MIGTRILVSTGGDLLTNLLLMSLFDNADAQGNVADRKYLLVLKNGFTGTADEAHQLINEASTPVSGAPSPITPRTMSDVS